MKATYLKRLLDSPYGLGIKVVLGRDPNHTIAVRNKTGLCIEGFPRSGNSYAVSMFRRGNPRLRIAHHTHDINNVKRAVSYAIPTLLLIRSPIDAISSLCIYDGAFAATQINERIDRYLAFYRAAANLPEQSLYFADFSLLINDFDQLIHHLNQKFNCRFRAIEDVQAAKKSVFSDYHRAFSRDNRAEQQFPFPTENRAEQKARLLPNILSSNKLAAAEDLYQALAR